MSALVGQSYASVLQALNPFAAAREAPVGDSCLTCGEPIVGERAIRLHGDVFHERCSTYRRKHPRGAAVKT